MRAEILVGDVLTRLAGIGDESAQSVVTSPPYWGLRDYGVPGQLGLERTPEEYAEKMVAVFREVRRVLRKDGTLWLNMGDSYSGGGGFSPDSPANQKRASGDSEAWGAFHPAKMDRMESRKGTGKVLGLKPKDLVGVPWRLAFALQADGWWLRSDIIWSKPNPMPESVTDRPTKAHEYVFLLTKSAKYFFDQDAVREADSGQQHHRNILSGAPSLEPSGGLKSPHGGLWGTPDKNGSGRNLRSVWTIATQPFPEAHFATFPEALAERCIKAGTSERGACAECGAPLARITESEPWERGKKRPKLGDHPLADDFAGSEYQKFRNENPSRTTGWRYGCAHGADPIPCLVLDPFAGSGTTGVVALGLQRSFVGIELNPAYAEMARRRIGSVAPLLSETELRHPGGGAASDGLQGKGARRPPEGLSSLPSGAALFPFEPAPDLPGAEDERTVTRG